MLTLAEEHLLAHNPDAKLKSGLDHGPEREALAAT